MFTRFEHDSMKIQGDTAFKSRQNLQRNVWAAGMRSRLTSTCYNLAKHFYAKFSVFEVPYLFEFISDYFQTWQICWFYDALSSDVNDLP